MKKLNEKEQIFIDLLRACHERDTYSLVEICPKMDISYQQVIQWANEDNKCARILRLCHLCCAANAEIAGIMKRIPPIAMAKYLYENAYPEG